MESANNFMVVLLITIIILQLMGQTRLASMEPLMVRLYTS